MSAVLTVTAVAKQFGAGSGATEALREADLHVESGEIVAVTGPSGSGKSTLLHVAAGILIPDAGTVCYRGEDLTGWSEPRRSALRRNQFGFVFQFGQLLTELTCRENVALPLRLSGVRRGTAEAAAQMWLERLGVPEVADHRAGAVSGGQAQRVAVARALVTDPEVVFADEPTGALDTLAGERVMTVLVQAARETATALVLVTHEPRVAAFADREVRVRDGRTGAQPAAA